MSLNRYAKRRDETEPQIVLDLRRCGYLVWLQDFPDLAVIVMDTGACTLARSGGDYAQPASQSGATRVHSRVGNSNRPKLSRGPSRFRLKRPKAVYISFMYVQTSFGGYLIGGRSLSFST